MILSYTSFIFLIASFSSSSLQLFLTYHFSKSQSGSDECNSFIASAMNCVGIPCDSFFRRIRFHFKSESICVSNDQGSCRSWWYFLKYLILLRSCFQSLNLFFHFSQQYHPRLSESQSQHLIGNLNRTEFDILRSLAIFFTTFCVSFPSFFNSLYCFFNGAIQWMNFSMIS